MPKWPTNKSALTSDAPTTATFWLLNGASLSASRLAALTNTLGPSELARLARFLRPQRAQEFLLGRLLLRHAVRHRLNIRNEQIAITEREGNAPSLSIDGSALAPLHFSLSHSHHWIACATSTIAPLGIDIEKRQQPRDLRALATVAFDLPQQAWLARHSEALLPAAFYRLWNCQEALYKLGAHQANANCRIIEHDQLAICLCSAQPLDSLALIELDQL